MGLERGKGLEREVLQGLGMVRLGLEGLLEGGLDLLDGVDLFRGEAGGDAVGG